MVISPLQIVLSFVQSEKAESSTITTLGNASDSSDEQPANAPSDTISMFFSTVSPSDVSLISPANIPQGMKFAFSRSK